METGTLYFEDHNGHQRIVAEGIRADQASHYATLYVNFLNPDFKIRYIRGWNDKDSICFDVGSHSEFFIFQKDKEVEN